MLLLCAASAFAVLPQTLIPGGNTVGLKAYAQGLVVTAVEENSPAEDAGLRAGDLLRTANGRSLSSVGELTELLASADTVELAYSRGGRQYTATVTPTVTENTKRLGICLRDSIAGIGTVTYYDPESSTFGALGHGINDVDGTTLLPIDGGVIVPSVVSGIVPSKRGTAGQLQGEFDVFSTVGVIDTNTENGVFGRSLIPDRAPLPVGSSEEVTTGSATILANVSGSEIGEYEVEILRIYDAGESGRNILLRVTDRELLEKTGGIVQGMSGSPVIQNGKLVGAVTHVLVNAPELGYGIFVENMLQEEAARRS